MSQAERIKHIRKEMGLTQAEFAEALGVSNTSVQNWESGRKPAGPDSLDKIAKLARCSQEWLYGIPDTKPYPEDSPRQQKISLPLKDLTASLKGFPFVAPGSVKAPLVEASQFRQQLEAKLLDAIQNFIAREGIDPALVLEYIERQVIQPSKPSSPEGQGEDLAADPIQNQDTDEDDEDGPIAAPRGRGRSKGNAFVKHSRSSQDSKHQQDSATS